MTKITAPKVPVPIGRVTVNGVTLDVIQHPEFVRFIFDLVRRVGGTEALTNTELEALAQALIDAGAVPSSSPEAQEALRGVEELRQALASLRGDNDRLRRDVEELRAQVECMPSLQPLERSVSEILDRLQ